MINIVCDFGSTGGAACHKSPPKFIYLFIYILLRNFV